MTAGAGPGLSLTDLTVRFGGLVALEDVSIEAPVGRLTGLIGPNGAGKTTLFNSCSGLIKPASGVVRLFGRDVTAASPARRAQLGLGRTFQRMELYDRMTVEDNVLIGREARVAGGNLLSLLWQPGPLRAELRRRRDEAIELCGLEALRGVPAGLLSTGQRRMVELARTVAGDYSVVLLDEPSSGLDHIETLEFGRILRQVTATRDIGLLLVEHDMSLVNSTCEYVYVLDFGRLIAEGPTADVMASAAVRAAYLGTEVG